MNNKLGMIKKKKLTNRKCVTLENPVNNLINVNKYMVKGPVVCASNPTKGLGSSKHFWITYNHSNSSGSRENSLNEIIRVMRRSRQKSPITMGFCCFIVIQISFNLKFVITNLHE
jgi:hypothetical protein